MLKSNLVVREVDSIQILEITQILLDDFYNLLRLQFGLYGFMGQFNSARVQYQETVKKLTHRLGRLSFLFSRLESRSLWLSILESLFCVNWVNDAVNCVGFKRVWDLLYRGFLLLLLSVPLCKDHRFKVTKFPNNAINS